jgi:hypothetical protein
MLTCIEQKRHPSFWLVAKLVEKVELITYLVYLLNGWVERVVCVEGTFLAWVSVDEKLSKISSYLIINRRAHIRNQCRKATVLSFHRCLINTGIEKTEQLSNIDYNFDHQMSPCKSKCWYSNNCLHFLKCDVLTMF